MAIKDQDIIPVLITEHAVLRLKERHPEIFKAFGFHPSWQYRYGDKFNENKVLMLEILKRSNEAKSIMNNMSILIQMCERHKMDIVNFRMFVFDNAIMLCEKNDRNELVIKTIADPTWNIARNVSKGDRNFDMESINYPEMTICDIGKHKQLEAYDRILKRNQFASKKFFSTGTPIGQDVLEQLEVFKNESGHMIQNEESEQIVITEQEKTRNHKKWVEKSINEYFQSLDLQMVCSNHKGDFIFFKPNCTDKEGNELPAFLKLSCDEVFNIYNSDSSLKTTFKQVKKMLSDRIELDLNDYLLLLAKSLPDNDNGLQIPQRDLKDYLKGFLPDDIKSDLKLNNKMLQKSNLEHLFLSPQYSSMINQSYFSLFEVKRSDMVNFMLIEAGKDRNFYLAKNKLSGELMFVSYQVIDGNESPVSTPLNNIEHFAVLNTFAKTFSDLSDAEKEIMEKSIPDENGDTLWQRIYRFGVSELNKYSHLRTMMDSVTKVLDRIPDKVSVIHKDEKLIVVGSDESSVSIETVGKKLAIVKTTPKR